MLEEHFESRRDFLSGRIHRLYDKKDTILVYDYVDVHIPMFDQEIVWYGNINLLGKQDVEDHIMRIQSKEIASELIEMTFGNSLYNYLNNF